MVCIYILSDNYYSHRIRPLLYIKKVFSTFYCHYYRRTLNSVTFCSLKSNKYVSSFNILFKVIWESIQDELAKSELKMHADISTKIYNIKRQVDESYERGLAGRSSTHKFSQKWNCLVKPVC